jgi:hypothetical protein
MSQKKLWVVKIKGELVVYAESAEEAAEVGERVSLTYPRDAGLNASFVGPLKSLPSGWDETCLPWSDVPIGESIGWLLKRGAGWEK